ncbi:LysM peptidoglycan-binding domain-containing protein [candidate division KSB1 bacterium]|nr:LysM peptidoglycan-binding domain-containing protein [candidate division KSB1 bacterium]
MRAVTKTLFACALLFVFILAAGVNISIAQEKMSMDEYEAQLQEWASRERAAKDEIAKLDAEIESLKQQIADVESQTEEVWDEIYSTIGVTEADVNAFRQELNDLEKQLDALAALSPEELFKRRKELDEIEAKVQEKKESRIAVLTEMRNKIAGLEGKIAQLRAKMPKGMYDEYTVVRGDYLWKISKKSDIYGDPMQWMRIYSFNREQIDDPDLIYPDWVLRIHRESGPNEYLVSRGDNLAKISGSMDIMGDPTKWRELYEANKDVIGDEPSLIYPYQVLKVPR